MCGRYVHPDQAAVERGWHIGRHNSGPFTTRYNVTPTLRVPILRWDTALGAFELTQAHWGFIPPWWKESKPPRHTINARTEEIATKPMWRGPFRQSRCLLPALGWYEWQPRAHIDPATGEVANFKQPYFIRPVQGGLIAFAGLYSERGAGDHAGSCTILTRASEGAVSAVHDRMPVVLDDAGMQRWGDPALKDPQSLMSAHARLDFTCIPVSTRVNQRGNEGESLIRALA